MPTNYTQLSPGVGGDKVYDEDLGGGLHMPVSKLYTGALGSNGAPVTSQNGLPASLYDRHGNPVDSDIGGALRVEQPYRLVGTTFGTTATGVDANFWTASNSGTGSSSSITTNGLVSLVCGTSNPGFGQVVTSHAARFVFAHPMLYRGQIRQPVVTVAGTTRTWGMYTVSGSAPVDGLYFGLSAAGVLSVNTLNSNSGTAVSVVSGAFNGLGGATYVLDTNVHIYEIMALQASVQFFIDGVLIHTSNPTTLMLSSTMNLPACQTCIGTGTSATMEVWAGMLLRLGRDHTAPNKSHIAGANAGVILKAGPGVLRLVALNAMVSTSAVAIYDALSATNPIALISGVSGEIPNSIEYNVDFYVGLFIVTVAANTDITVSYE